MPNLARIAKHPMLSGYFEVVHPIFWPVLLWQLLKIAGQIKSAGSCEALIFISWWGGVRLHYLGDPAPSPSAYSPVDATRAHWSDACWSSAVPAEFSTEALPFILPRSRGLRGKSVCTANAPRREGGGNFLAPLLDTS